jgi:hypothetical protein
MQDAGCRSTLKTPAGLSLNVYTPHSTLSSVFSPQSHSHTSVSNGSFNSHPYTYKNEKFSFFCHFHFRNIFIWNIFCVFGIPVVFFHYFPISPSPAEYNSVMM